MPKCDERIYVEQLYEETTFTLEGTDTAAALLSNLPSQLQPVVPFEYKWFFKEGQYTLKKHLDGQDQKIQIITFGPYQDKIHYLCQINNVTVQSFAHTRQKTFNPEKRKYPMDPARKNYFVPNFLYREGKYHTPGHCIDHADTFEVGDEANYSTNDKRNYIPEPPKSYWGLHVRSHVVKALRRNSGAYMQIPYYSLQPLVTYDGTMVPEGVFFSEIYDNKITKTYDVNWQYKFDKTLNKKGLGFTTDLESYSNCLPLANVYKEDATDKQIDIFIKKLSTIQNKFLNGLYNNIETKHIISAYDEKLSELEYVSPQYKFLASFRASEQQNEYKAERFLKRAFLHAEFLNQLDDKRNIVAKDILKKCNLKFKNENPGFLDKDNSKIDWLHKINADQAERQHRSKK